MLAICNVKIMLENEKISLLLVMEMSYSNVIHFMHLWDFVVLKVWSVPVKAHTIFNKV